MSHQRRMSSSTYHFTVLICQMACCFFLHKSHYVSKSKLHVSIDVHFIFVQVLLFHMSKTYKNFVKNTHCTSAFISTHITKQPPQACQRHIYIVLCYTNLKQHLWDMSLPGHMASPPPPRTNTCHNCHLNNPPP